jgi:glycosyltransferase involved in cell wall biosynthesis
MLMTAAPTRSRPHVAVLECDIAAGLDPVAALDERGEPWTGVEILVRAFTEPLGVVRLPIGPGGISAVELAEAIVADLETEVAERVRACGRRWSGMLSTDGLDAVVAPPFLVGRARAAKRSPSVTVVICTRDRPEGVGRMLDSLRLQQYDRMNVLVVDNAPSDDRTRRMVEWHRSGLDVRYTVEPRPGLSWARNHAIDVADGEIIAWVDDDEVCDRWWVSEIARAFVEHPEAGAVSGAVLAAEIETPAQQHFEQFGGHTKGRGFTPAVFSPATRAIHNPLYPLPPFGVGANLAFRRDALEMIGGFDTALGAGTVTNGAEDTAAISTLLFLGGTAVYHPSAIVRHTHRREDAALLKQFEGYGTGLGAFYTSMLLRHPRSIVDMLRLLPRALHDLTSPHGARLADLPSDFPAGLLAANRAAMLRGPYRYLQARRIAGRLRRQPVLA